MPPPAKIFDVKPVYPKDAQEAKVEGIVLLEVTIGAEGHVQEATIVHSIPMLDQAALDAVRQWVFAPTIIDGRAQPVVMTVTINFTLM